MAYTTIDDPSAHFHTLLWTGNGADNRALTNDANAGNFKPDWVWVKGRSAAEWHNVYDSIRGANKSLYPNDTYQEESLSETFESFDTNGFTVSYNSAYGSVFTNKNSTTYVAWQWKANGGTTSSNTDGNITTTVQANPTAGFSLVFYTGNGVQTGKTVGHGLGAVPKMIISKDRDATSNVPTWRVYHEGIGNTKYLTLNATDAASTYNDWDNTTPTSSVYSVGGAGGYTPTNTSNTEYIAYVFADVQGYSKFGKYVGNGSSNGPFVYTGFAPAFVMLKDTSQATNWEMFDVKRNPSNVRNLKLGANLTVAENGSDLGNTSQNNIDILSNGFKMRTGNTDTNVSGDTYIYMAFAENPFVTSTGIPATAR
jgi:hypothetical protein